MKAFNASAILLLHTQGAIPQVLLDGWRTKKSDAIETATEVESGATVRFMWIVALLVAGCALVSKASTHFYNDQVGTATVFAVCGAVALAIASAIGLRHWLQIRSVTCGFGLAYASILAYAGMTATSMTRMKPDEISSLARMLLQKQAGFLTQAEALSRSAPNYDYLRRTAVNHREEFRVMFNAMANLGLVNREAGWTPFVGVSIDHTAVAAA